MERRRRKASATLIMTVGLLLFGGGIAQAQDACFNAFGGFLNFVFNMADFTVSSRTSNALGGRVTGIWSGPCAGGLREFPIIGGSVFSPDGTKVILAFRMMSADADACGAVDFIATIDFWTLSGPIEFYNSRTNVGGKSEIVMTSCTFSESPPVSSGVRNPLGNPVP